MAVRVFDGVDDVIVLDEGTLDTVFNGACSVVIGFKKDAETTDVTQFLLSFDAGTNSNQRAAVSIDGSGGIQYTIGGITRTFGLTITNGVWYLFVVTKANGTATPRANLYNYTSASWAGWANGDDTLDNDGTTLVEVRMGNGPGSFPLSGKMFGAAVYGYALSDVQGETLENAAQNWFDLGPMAMWRLNQASTATPVPDDTGNGANQTAITGTSVDTGDDPAGFNFNLTAAVVVGYSSTGFHPGAGPTNARFWQSPGAFPPSADQDIAPTGIASAEAFGTAVVTATADIAPTGIASAEAFGTAVVSPGAVDIAPTGIASAEAFGIAVVSASNTIAPTGIASAEAFGTAVISATATIAPSGIASAEAFGTAVISAGPVDVSPTGVASAEAFGTAVITTGTVDIAPTGIASAEAFGMPIVSLDDDQIVGPSGIASAEAFGTAVISAGTATIAPTGIASSEAFGTAVISSIAIIAPTGIGSGEAFGTPAISAGPVDIAPSGIVSAEAFGTPTVFDSSLGHLIVPTGIPSGERFGTATVWKRIVRACDCSMLVDD